MVEHVHVTFSSGETHAQHECNRCGQENCDDHDDNGETHAHGRPPTWLCRMKSEDDLAHLHAIAFFQHHRITLSVHRLAIYDHGIGLGKVRQLPILADERHARVVAAHSRFLKLHMPIGSARGPAEADRRGLACRCAYKSHVLTCIGTLNHLHSPWEELERSVKNVLGG